MIEGLEEAVCSCASYLLEFVCFWFFFLKVMQPKQLGEGADLS